MGGKLTTSEFIERARIKHADRYVYDKTIYITARDKIIITCKLHGDFEKHPFKHLDGRGCSECGKNDRAKRNQPKGESLAELNPELVKQWHPTKNGDLTAYDVHAGSEDYAWWKCDKADDHEWELKVRSKIVGSMCPFCSNRRVSKSTCLAITNPDLAKQWHPTKNGDLTPYDVHARSRDKVWWKCDKGDDHEWDAEVKSRNSGNGCSICANQKIVLSNCLATTNPDLAKQWHPTKNGDLTPYDVNDGSGKTVWWKCDKGDDHEWQSNVRNRNIGSGCSICSGYKVVRSNCLATTHPEIAKQWHPTKNGDLTPYDVYAGSHDTVWWKCNKADDHEWKKELGRHTRPESAICPFCSNMKVSKSNCLATTNPDLAKQWHPIKNGELTPYDVHAGSQDRAWWKCDKGDDHEWDAQIGSRNMGYGCPICSNLLVTKSNCLATTHPELAKEWHPTKNGDLTPYNITAGSGKSVWWKCSKGDDHEWKTDGYHRSIKKSGCPFCTLTPQSRQELTITFELIQFFKDINPKGFKTRINGKTKSIDIYIPKLKLGIEFDGNYWHKDNAAKDKLKTVQLEEEGFEIFRVREEPLEKLFDDDIMSKQPFNPKQVVNDILTQIMSRYTLEVKKITKIESYIAKKELQNEKGLDKYIDMILTEKAEKKK